MYMFFFHVCSARAGGADAKTVGLRRLKPIRVEDRQRKPIRIDSPPCETDFDRPLSVIQAAHELFTYSQRAHSLIVMKVVTSAVPVVAATSDSKNRKIQSQSLQLL